MQYAHTHREEFSLPGTLVLAGVTKDHLHQLFTGHCTQLMMQLGLSVTSPRDHFTKKIGREHANKRIAPVPASFVRLALDGTKHIYSFETSVTLGVRKYNVNFDITTLAESDSAKLISAYIYE